MLRIIVTIAIVLLIAWKVRDAMSGTGGGGFPNRPIHVVVPYTAGGETDTLARIIQEAVTSGDLLPQPFVIQNQPGGSGTIGSRYVKNALPDGYKILCHHESIITANVSGTVAFDSDGNTIGEGDAYAQATQIFKNISEALACGGASMDDVIKITTFLTDMSYYGDFGKARTEAFPNGVPASAAYTTPALIKPELLVEVEAIAVVGSGS